MAPRRKKDELPLKSIWDEDLVKDVFPNKMHRTKMWNWLVRHLDITNLDQIPFEEWLFPRDGYQRIRREFSMFTSKIVDRKESVRGDTTKLLVELQDGHQIETVVMRHLKHATVCVSSQIGCQMGCR